jgi:hypothetical protein
MVIGVDGRAAQWRRAACAAAAVGSVSLPLGAACSSPPCFGLKVGDQFAITVVDTIASPGLSYDAGRADVCGFGLDFSPGEVIIATDVATMVDSDGFCKTARASLAPAGGWTWTPVPGPIGSGSSDFLAGRYRATNGVCTGGVDIYLDVTSGADPLAPSVPGQVPNVVMSRRFVGSGSGPGCPGVCSGRFVVNVRKI